MKKIEIGPEARKLLMRLFMEGYINCPEPLTGEEIEVLCTLTGLQVLGMHLQTHAFKEEMRATMQGAAKRTGSPLLGGTLEVLPEGH